MRSVVDRNVVMRRIPVFNERHSALEHGCDTKLVSFCRRDAVTPCEHMSHDADYAVVTPRHQQRNVTKKTQGSCVTEQCRQWRTVIAHGLRICRQMNFRCFVLYL